MVGGVVVGFAVIALLNAWIDKETNHEVAHIDENHPRTSDSLEELTHANHLHEHMEGRQPRSGLFLAGLVMAAAMTVGLYRFPISFCTIKTGRSPPCSLPTTGLRSA